MDFGLEVVGRKSSCGATVNLELISFPRDATAPDGLIVPRDTSFFKTYCYLIASFGSSMSLASGTRKRPPQSGFVQTGLWEVPNEGSGGIASKPEVGLGRHLQCRPSTAQP